MLGLSRSEARELELAVRHLALSPDVAAAVAWHDRATHALAAARSAQRWLPTETLDSMLASRPE